MNVFKIAFSKGEYSVSIHGYPGGDVVEYDEAKALADELAKEREKSDELRRLLQSVHSWFMQTAPEHYNGCGLWIDVDITLNETKQNQTNQKD